MKFYLKIENNQIVQAPEKMVKNGYTVYGYNHESNESMLFADGYAAYPMNKYCYEIKDGAIIEKQPEIIVRNVFNKLEIRRALRQAGIEHKLDELLASSEQFNHDWNDAVEIDLQEQPVASAIQSGLISQDMIDAIRGI